jgi:hypothetical protein
VELEGNFVRNHSHQEEMMLMKYFIGLDTHSKSSIFAVINQEGSCVLRREFPTTEKSLKSVLEQINGERHFVFEECHLAQWVYNALSEKVDRLVVCYVRRRRPS